MIDPAQLETELRRELNRLAKWRSIFAGWQLGTRKDSEREQLLMLRVEASALTGLLIKKGVISQQEFQAALIDETRQYQLDLEKRFPGVRAQDYGLQINPQVFAQTTKGWKP